MPRAEARSGRPWAQQVSLPLGQPPVIIVTPAGSWPSPWVAVGVDRIDVVGQERRLGFPQPEGLQAAAEARAQPAERFIGRIPGLARFRLRMVLASVAHSRPLARKLRIFARPAGPKYVPIGAPSWRHYSFKDSAAMIGLIRWVTDGLVQASNALPQLVMADLLMVQQAGFTTAMRCAPATEASSTRYTSAGDSGVAQEPS